MSHRSWVQALLQRTGMACVCRRRTLAVAHETRPRAAGLNFQQTGITINDNLF